MAEKTERSQHRSGERYCTADVNNIRAVASYAEEIWKLVLHIEHFIEGGATRNESIQAAFDALDDIKICAMKARGICEIEILGDNNQDQGDDNGR